MSVSTWILEVGHKTAPWLTCHDVMNSQKLIEKFAWYRAPFDKRLFFFLFVVSFTQVQPTRRPKLSKRICLVAFFLQKCPFWKRRKTIPWASEFSVSALKKGNNQLEPLFKSRCYIARGKRWRPRALFLPIFVPWTGRAARRVTSNENSNKNKAITGEQNEM